jgi:beta-1,4-mannosyl-glycoprotein beta-1,4-N-acetylglucosaminyltransferase
MKFFTNNRRILTRLSSLFFLQLLLIFAFVLFGAFVSNSNDGVEPWASGNVKFITKDSRSSSHTSKTEHEYKTPTFMRIVKSENFHKQFITLQEEVAISSDIEEKIRVKRVCYKEGVELNDSHRASHDVNNKTEDYADWPACVCRSEWHGNACSEPEIIWRTFMVSRQPMKESPKFTRHPHNIFYIINGVTSINLETFEIQLMELGKIVNLFVLCDLVKADDPSLLMRHQMDKGFLVQYKEQILLLRDETCSGANIYRHMKRILGTQMRPSDVLIYGHEDEILNRRAVNYMKWHNNWHQPLRFRLKWNVYGFFFQHPDNTITSSVACQVNSIEQFYKSDPEKILSNSQSPTVVTVGDLNHYGGWFCEYCHQPIDIIRKLHLDSKYLANKSSDPLKESYHRKPIVNIEYIQNLIQYGHYIDGKLELRKLRHYDDTDGSSTIS